MFADGGVAVTGVGVPDGKVPNGTVHCVAWDAPSVIRGLLRCGADVTLCTKAQVVKIHGG